MSKKLVVAFVFYCMTVFYANGQKFFTLSGRVSDKSTGESLIHATIYDSVLHRGTISNSFGYYSISLAANSQVSLVISYIGYEKVHRSFAFESDTIIDFNLTPNLSIDEITIVSQKNEKIEDRDEMGSHKIQVEQIKKLPSLGGEKDVLKIAQMLPGIKFGDEGKSGIYVRGGSPDQNLMLLDDVPLYYVNHLGGYVSVFNPDAINNIDIIKGSMPAKYGGRLSSVFDIRMKEGNLKKINRNVTFGLISDKFMIEGPVKTDTSSFLISARRFMYDIFLWPISKMTTDVGVGYTFYDINAKFNHRFSAADKVYFSFYTGDDKFSTGVEENEKKGFDSSVKAKTAWGNLAGSFRWNHFFSQQFFGNLTLSYSRYRYSLKHFQDKKNQYTDQSYFSSKINDLILKYDFEIYSNSGMKIETGIGTIYHTFKPGVTEFEKINDGNITVDTIFNNRKYNSFESSAYFSVQKKINPGIGLNVGVRATNYHVNRKDYYSIEPRILLNKKINGNSSLKYSFSYLKQYVQLLSSSGLGMPSDLWVLSTDKVPPQQSLQNSIGFFQTTYEKNLELSIEAYYKKMSGLIDYQEGATLFYGSTEWQQKIEKDGKGDSYGLEFLLQKNEGRTTGWAGATISRSTRRFRNINEGKVYPYSYDRLLDIGIAASHKISDKLYCSATWIFNTGNAITLPVGTHVAIDEENEFTGGSGLNTTIEIYEGKNTFRAKPYHRLDLGIEYKTKKKNRERVLSFSIYNAYNRKNPFYYYSEIKATASGNPLKKAYIQVSYFPIIPSVSYSINF